MKLASIQRGSSKCPSTVTQTVFFQALTQDPPMLSPLVPTLFGHEPKTIEFFYPYRSLYQHG